MQPEALELKVRQWSRKMHDALQDVHRSKLSEADFRRVIDPLLVQFCEQIGDTSLARAEYTLATGRADAVFNRMVIEYERPGKLKKIPDAATRQAVQQVKDYLEGLAKKRASSNRASGWGRF